MFPSKIDPVFFFFLLKLRKEIASKFLVTRSILEISELRCDATY